MWFVRPHQWETHNGLRAFPRFAGSFALALIKSPLLKVWAAAFRLANYPRNGRGLQHGPLKGLPGSQPQSGLDLLNLAAALVGRSALCGRFSTASIARRRHKQNAKPFSDETKRDR